MSVALPRIVSPNLGCPRILSPKDLAATGADIVVALDPGEDARTVSYSLEASPSNSGEGRPFDLLLVDPVPLDDDELPADFGDVAETWLLISTTLRREVFQGAARFWRFRMRVAAEPAADTLRQTRGAARATLFDLILRRYGREACSVPHALCLRPPAPEVRFVHLTDLHVAVRNDIWAREVNRTVHPGDNSDPIEFINFNDRLRRFIGWANERADAGELDFVLALGDLVDFVQHGFDKNDPGPNNWDLLIEILTGSPEEARRGNPGLRLPLFTTTGNHDWRPFPYPPGFNAAIFGLDSGEAGRLDYLYYDSSRLVGERILEVHTKLVREGSPILARPWWGSALGLGLPWLELQWERISSRVLGLAGRYLRAGSMTVGTALLGMLGHSGAVWMGWLDGKIWERLPDAPAAILLVLAAAALMPLAQAWFASQLRTKITALLGIESSAGGLRDYFLRFNPYFNYAVRLENCYFLILDTGHDCLTAQSFWDEGGKKLGPVSVRDNIIGGSPDTMAFYPPNEYYHYSQIAWLDQVLGAIGRRHGQTAGEPRRCRIFIGVHTPPANLSRKQRARADSAMAAGGGAPVPMRRRWLGGYDIRYGTINHYLSEFFYLCLGYREAAQREPSGPGVDAVLAGHAHWSIEFEIRRPAAAAASWDPELRYGRFSESIEAGSGAPDRWWGPLVLQTGACGPPSATDPDTPNFRYIVVDPRLGVRRLRPTTLNVAAAAAAAGP